MSQSKFTVPEPQIVLYETGFKDLDRLGRYVEGRKLSTLVEKVSQPMIVAVDAPWGAGKTIFLKCWVGAHVAENGGTARTVYFDAFRHDYMDDPLISLIGEISERFPPNRKNHTLANQAKLAAAKFRGPLARIGLALATAGVSEVTGVVLDQGLSASADELKRSAEAFWRKEESRTSAMAEFRSALSNLASEEKLVIVIDELDRCRPDYALALLEVIKHFFDVPKVHFILGTNLEELTNSVKARYGLGIDAHRYLHKFVTITMPLVPRRDSRGSNALQIQHFKNVSQEIGLSDIWIYPWIKEYLNHVDHHFHIGLRDVERIATLAMVCPPPDTKVEAAYHLFAGLLVLKVLCPDAIRKARTSQPLGHDIFRVFDFSESSGQAASDAKAVWTLATLTYEERAVSSNKLDRELTKLYQSQEPKSLVRWVIEQSLDRFELY